MDWLVEPGVAGAERTVTGMIVDQLRRRAAAPERAVEAEPLVREALAVPAACLWARLDWEQVQPELTVRARAEPLDDPGSALADGVWSADRPTAELAETFDGGPAVRVSLPVARGPVVDLDLAPSRVVPEDGAGYPGAVASILAGQLESGRTIPEAAAVAGATAAGAALGAWHAEQDRSPTTAAEVADAFLAFVNRAGADFAVVEADGRRAVVANRRCPFGSGSPNPEVLCRSTAALLGSLGARLNGRATVVLDESIAAGDHRCRAVLDLDGEPSRWNQSYTWPPAGPAGSRGAAVTQGFRVAISLQLPRDQVSVPLIRHMVANTLREVGAVDDDVSAVEIAVSEAAGNVIRHSGAGDAYDVEVTIGPQLVELRVIDIGRGFDSESIHSDAEDLSAESGRGMALMHALVDQATFASAPERGTVVHLVKALHFDEGAPARRLMLSQLAEHNAAGEDTEPGGTAPERP